MSDTFDEPPDDGEAYESLDEALDDEDLPGSGGSHPEGERDLDTDLVVDQTELEEAGAQFDDPERISILDGGMDDPDGSGPPDDDEDDEAGWDVDPVEADREGEQSDVDADGDEVTDDVLLDVPEIDPDPELELIDTDPADLEQIADDAPGADSARW
jgi:hypothetical protein